MIGSPPAALDLYIPKSLAAKFVVAKPQLYTEPLPKNLSVPTSALSIVIPPPLATSASIFPAKVASPDESMLV